VGGDGGGIFIGDPESVPLIWLEVPAAAIMAVLLEAALADIREVMLEVVRLAADLSIASTSTSGGMGSQFCTGQLRSD